MQNYAYYNGSFLPYEEMKIPLSDRAVYFGDGVYDVILGGQKRMYQFSEHINRLLSNASLIGLSHLPDGDSLFATAKELIEYAKAEDDFALYIQLSRYSTLRQHIFENSSEPNLLITACKRYAPSSEPLDLITLPDLRYKMCNIKTINLLPAVLAAEKANEAGADEAVFVKDGLVTECSHSNIFILQRNTLVTHPKDSSILPGITRENLIKVSRALGIEVAERAFSVNEMLEADEIIVTSTTAFARRCRTVDGVRCGMKNERIFMKLKNSLLCDYNAMFLQV